jgi:hypothetical protein
MLYISAFFAISVPASKASLEFAIDALIGAIRALKFGAFFRPANFDGTNDPCQHKVSNIGPSPNTR